MRAAIRPFLDALMFGALAGSAPSLFFAPFALLPSAGGTLVGMLVVGLPLTFLLRKLRQERLAYYVIAGVVFGFTFPIALVGPLALFGRITEWGLLIYFAISGTLAGAVSAYSWGLWRMTRRER